MDLDLETEDILDLIENDDQDIERVEEGAPPNDENQTEVVERDGSDGEAAEGQAKTVKPKRIVRNPQPKLNAETLKGPRGLSIIKDLFSKQKYRGKGREEEDLNFLLTLYSYWAHRLFPKFTFEQCISRIEKLGQKKAVMTYVKKIRLGMEEEAYENNEIVSDDDDVVNEMVNSAPPRNDSFDRLLDKDPEPKLTEEQQERIRINRERALKLRAERLKRIKDQAESTLKNFNLDEASLTDKTTAIRNSPDLMENNKNNQSRESDENRVDEDLMKNRGEDVKNIVMDVEMNVNDSIEDFNAPEVSANLQVCVTEGNKEIEDLCTPACGKDIEDKTNTKINECFQEA